MNAATVSPVSAPPFEVCCLFGIDRDVPAQASFDTALLASAYIDGMITAVQEGEYGVPHPVKSNPSITCIEWSDGRREKFALATKEEALAFGQGVQRASGWFQVHLVPDASFVYDEIADRWVSPSAGPLETLDWSPDWYEPRLLPDPSSQAQSKSSRKPG